MSSGGTAPADANGGANGAWPLSAASPGTIASRLASRVQASGLASPTGGLAVSQIAYASNDSETPVWCQPCSVSPLMTISSRVNGTLPCSASLEPQAHTLLGCIGDNIAVAGERALTCPLTDAAAGWSCPLGCSVRHRSGQYPRCRVKTRCPGRTPVTGSQDHRLPFFQ